MAVEIHFMTNLYERFVAGLGLELAICANGPGTEAGHFLIFVLSSNKKMQDSIKDCPINTSCII